MQLYVCYGTFKTPRPGGHPCANAHQALVEAGYEPEVIRSYGLGPLPSMLNGLTSGRREVKRLTGSYWVPLLVTDDGTVVEDSHRIVEWANQHPAGARAHTATA
jgi:Glutathione S-transferase, N-terminal domain